MNPPWNPYHTDVLPSGLLTDFNFTLSYRLNQSCLFEKKSNSQKSALQTKRAAVLLLSCGANLKVINMARPFNRSQSSAEVTNQLDLYTAVIFLKGKHVTSRPGYHKHLLEKPTRSTVNSFFVGHQILPNSQIWRFV